MRVELVFITTAVAAYINDKSVAYGSGRVSHPDSHHRFLGETFVTHIADVVLEYLVLDACGGAVNRYWLCPNIHLLQYPATSCAGGPDTMHHNKIRCGRKRGLHARPSVRSTYFQDFKQAFALLIVLVMSFCICHVWHFQSICLYSKNNTAHR